MTMVTSPITTTATIIWRNSIRQGIFHHQTIEIQQITTVDVELIDEIHHNTYRIPLSEIAEVFIMNQHSLGVSNYYGYGVGHGVRIYGGMSHSDSNQVGDVVILAKNGFRITFAQIAAPSGVVAMIKAQMKIH